MSRQTLQTGATLAAPLKTIIYILPWWMACLLLMLFMPTTGLVSVVVMSLSLVILPFKARSGVCPACHTLKLFPFSGFGSACKCCGQELVLRGIEIHLLASKSASPKVGSGRGQRLLPQNGSDDKLLRKMLKKVKK